MTNEIQTAAAPQIAPGQQVITIELGGAMSGLQYENGKGVDLRQFGRADIRRASEVIFCTERQMWHVEFRHAGVYSGKPLTVSLLAAARGLPAPDAASAEDPAYFHDYAQGVAGEIDVMNYFRLNDPAGLNGAAA